MPQGNGIIPSFLKLGEVVNKFVLTVFALCFSPFAFATPQRSASSTVINAIMCPGSSNEYVMQYDNPRTGGYIVVNGTRYYLLHLFDDGKVLAQRWLSGPAILDIESELVCSVVSYRRFP